MSSGTMASGPGDEASRGNVSFVVPLSALALVAGILAAVPYVIRIGPRLPRPLTAALLGAGLGGLSASFAGWSAQLALAAAIGAGGALAGLAVALDGERSRGLRR